VSLVIETDDLDAALAVLSAERGVIRVRNCGEQARLRLVRDSIGSVVIDRVTLSADFDADVGPADVLVFGQVSSGAVSIRAQRTERRYARGEVYLAGQPRSGRTLTAGAGEHEQVVIDPDLIGQVAEPAPGQAAGAVRFTGYWAVSQQAADMWRSAYGYVRDTVLADPASADHPLLVANAARLLAVTALAAFPNDAVTEPTVQDRHDGSPATLRRALAYIDEHAHEAIAAADVAAASSVTIRAVQLAFRRHLDITPTEYIRRIRLDYAHRQLLTADPGHESVTAVASRWGFSSPSRFAAAYRKAYGLRPSQTLRGAPGSSTPPACEAAGD